MSPSIHVCCVLLLALASVFGPQGSDEFLTVNVSDTDEKKVDQIVITCKENCVPARSVNGVIKLKLPPSRPRGNSITLEIVKQTDYPNWMIVSPSNGRVPAPAADGKSNETVSLTVVNIGREDPDNAQRLDELARRYYLQKKYDEAEVLCRKAFEISKNILGPEHEATVETLRHLGIVYEEQKRYADAEALYKQVLKVREKTRPEQPETAEVMTNLANVYYHQAKYPERLPLYKRAFAIYEKSLGLDAEETVECFQILIDLYVSANQKDEAESLYQRVLGIYERTSGKTVSDKRRKNMIELLEQYGNFLLQNYWERDFRVAMKLIDRASDLRESTENSGAAAQHDPKRQMKKYLRSMGFWGLFGDFPYEIREFEHSLLSKYLPDYKFYIAYIPAHPAIYEEDGKTLKYEKSDAGYYPCLGITDRENRLTVFNNLTRIPIASEYRKYWPVIEDFLTTARIQRSAPLRTDEEMQDITRLYLVLSQLKGLDGFGFIAQGEKGLPAIHDPKTEGFKVDKEEGKTKVSYDFETPDEVLRGNLSFDREGNITECQAVGQRMNYFDRIRRPR